MHLSKFASPSNHAHQKRRLLGCSQSWCCICQFSLNPWLQQILRDIKVKVIKMRVSIPVKHKAIQAFLPVPCCFPLSFTFAVIQQHGIAPSVGQHLAVILSCSSLISSLRMKTTVNSRFSCPATNRNLWNLSPTKMYQIGKQFWLSMHYRNCNFCVTPFCWRLLYLKLWWYYKRYWNLWCALEVCSLSSL